MNSKLVLIAITALFINACSDKIVKRQLKPVNLETDSSMSPFIGTWYSASPSDPKYYSIETQEEIEEWKETFLADSVFKFICISEQGEIISTLYRGIDFQDAYVKYLKGELRPESLYYKEGQLCKSDTSYVLKMNFKFNRLLYRNVETSFLVTNIGANSFGLQHLMTKRKLDDYVIEFFRL